MGHTGHSACYSIYKYATLCVPTRRGTLIHYGLIMKPVTFLIDSRFIATFPDLCNENLFSKNRPDKTRPSFIILYPMKKDTNPSYLLPSGQTDGPPGTNRQHPDGPNSDRGRWCRAGQLKRGQLGSNLIIKEWTGLRYFQWKYNWVKSKVEYFSNKSQQQKVLRLILKNWGRKYFNCCE